MYLYPAVFVYNQFLCTIIFRLLVRINTISKKRGCIANIGRQERKVKFYITFIPVCHPANVPVDIFLSYTNDIFSHFTCGDKGRIRLHRNWSDEVHTFLFIQIIRRSIAQHGERRIVYNIGGQLMTTGSHTHRWVIDGTPVGFRCIAHGTRSIIYRTCHHTDIREGHIVERHVILDIRPLHLFHTEQALKVDDIRISAIDTCRFVNAMEVECQLMFCRSISDTIYHFNSSLIVTI